MRATSPIQSSTTHSHTELGTLGVLIDDHQNDTRLTRTGVITAAVLHVVAFAFTWPSLAGPAPEPPQPQPIRIVRLHVYSPPERRPPEIPQAPIRRSVPIPDPTPDDPEPIRDDEIQIEDTWSPDLVPVHVVAPDPPPPAVPSVVEVFRDIEPPARIHTVQPRYTKAALHARLTGAVIIELTIDTAGHVAEVKVLRGLPLGLTESAVDAARQWRFEPSRFNGHPVSVIYQLTVQFTLKRH